MSRKIGKPEYILKGCYSFVKGGGGQSESLGKLKKKNTKKKTAVTKIQMKTGPDFENLMECRKKIPCNYKVKKLLQ